MNPTILDACCGGRMCWFDKKNPAVIFSDNRMAAKGHIWCSPGHEVSPDVLADFREMPWPDKSFGLVLFDPPHIPSNRAGKSGKFAKAYGILFDTWQSDLTAGFDECWRVLKAGGVLIFKWSSAKLPLEKVLACFSERPLFGHTTNNKGTTHWICFMKGAE